MQSKEAWDLAKWLSNCYGNDRSPRNEIYPYFKELASIAKQEGMIWWTKEELKRNTFHEWQEHGIPKREDQKAMIAVLRRIASLHRQSIFSDKTLDTDIKDFLSSAACRNEDFFILKDTEILDIRILVPLKLDDSFSRLHRRIYPKPPNILRGRTESSKLVKESIQNNLITVLGTLPGQGKTSLAWHIGVELVTTGNFRDFDWTTHKYSLINPQTGEKKKLDPTKYQSKISQGSTMNFDDILISMGHRFRWLDNRALDPLLRQDRCAALLRDNKYLIVIDNIETAPDIEEIVNFFSKLQGYGLPHFESRILITSRHFLTVENIQNIDLKGIEESGVLDFFGDLASDYPKQAMNQLPNIADEQYRELWATSHGIPLLMMFSFYHLCAGTSYSSVINGLKHASEDFEIIFENMFGDLLSTLHPAHQKLAQVAAIIDLRNYAITYETLKNAWQTIDPNNEISNGLLTALQELTKYRIITQNSAGQYTIHSLIRAFLTQKGSQ
jgi:hypothetical protein